MMTYHTLREIWNNERTKVLVENHLAKRFELVDCRQDAVLFDRYGKAQVISPDTPGWTLIPGQFPIILEEVKTVSNR